MKLKELFDVETVVPFEYDGHTIAFHFRNPTADEEQEFRRRTSKQRIKDNGTLEATDVALKAPLWLFDRLVKKITISNGNESAEDVAADEYKDIPEQTKLEAIAAHRGRIKKKETDDLRD